MEEMTANEILDDGMRRIKVVSDAEINAAQWQRRVPREARDLAKPLMEHDPALGIWTLEMTYPARDVVFGALIGGERYDQPMVVWRLVDGDRVSGAIRSSVVIFERFWGRKPQFAWMLSLPAGVDEFTDVDGVILLQADWVYRFCVFVGG